MQAERFTPLRGFVGAAAVEAGDGDQGRGHQQEADDGSQMSGSVPNVMVTDRFMSWVHMIGNVGTMPSLPGSCAQPENSDIASRWGSGPAWRGMKEATSGASTTVVL